MRGGKLSFLCLLCIFFPLSQDSLLMFLSILSYKGVGVTSALNGLSFKPAHAEWWSTDSFQQHHTRTALSALSSPSSNSLQITKMWPPVGVQRSARNALRCWMGRVRGICDLSRREVLTVHLLLDSLASLLLPLLSSWKGAQEHKKPLLRANKSMEWRYSSKNRNKAL